MLQQWGVGYHCHCFTRPVQNQFQAASKHCFFRHKIQWKGEKSSEKILVLVKDFFFGFYFFPEFKLILSSYLMLSIIKVLFVNPLVKVKSINFKGQLLGYIASDSYLTAHNLPNWPDKSGLVFAASDQLKVLSDGCQQIPYNTYNKGYFCPLFQVSFACLISQIPYLVNVTHQSEFFFVKVKTSNDIIAGDGR